MIRVSNIRLSLNDEEDVLAEKIIKKLRIKKENLKKYTIHKKSIDARKKNEIYFVYSVNVKINNEEKVLSRIKNGVAVPVKDISYKLPQIGNKEMRCRPIIIGTGPSGLFAGLILSRMGYRPILLERGDDVDTRAKKVNTFWRNGKLDTESNVQFGEGGAGTFSDGKLTTLINDKRCRLILEEFINAGAPSEIIYLSKPHIGTDLLKGIVKNIRHEIIKNGGEVRFNAKVTDFIIKNDEICGVVINDLKKIEANIVLLGIGHSARDTFDLLYNRDVNIIPKPFSIGVRIEHPQELINRAQYGKYYNHPKLGAADYKLSYHSKNRRSAYTFCMCPGGYVVAAASENNRVVLNGMSKYKRDGKNANSALLVGVSPQDYGSNHPLAGVEFQRKWEELAFKIAGNNYFAPVQLVGDFLNDRVSTQFGRIEPTYKPGVAFADLRKCLPNYIIETMKEAILYFDNKIKGFGDKDAVMTGVETRSSSPIRIKRDDKFQSNLRGLYPMGEGAGYAGGIMSSAVDGIRIAEKVIEEFKPQQIE